MIYWTLMVFTILLLHKESFTIDNTVMITATNRQMTKNLSCYSCSSLDNDDCLNISLAEYPPTKDCNQSKSSCAVTRIEYERKDQTDTIFWALERICMPDCIPGCIVLGERTRLHYCTSCCSENLCNVSSFALSSNSVYPFMLSVSIILIVIYHLFKS